MKHYHLFIILFFFVTFLGSQTLYGKNSLGIGSQETNILSTHGNSKISQSIYYHQKKFYRSLTETLQKIKKSEAKLSMLMALSFGYGVIHAIGPGHGKIILSSYVLANTKAISHAITISSLAAIMQSITAIMIIGVSFFVLYHTPFSMDNLVQWLEILSYIMLSGFGLWLLWKKTSSAIQFFYYKKNIDQPSCCSCTHTQMPIIAKKFFHLKQAIPTIISIGLRPCSGALFILSFCFLNQLWLIGILSSLAMAIGVGITTSCLVILTISGKNWITKNNKNSFRTTIYLLIEILGSLFLFLFGLAFLLTSLNF